MKTSRIAYTLITTCAAGAFLAGCSMNLNAVPPHSTGASQQIRAASSHYHVLYDFHGSDGARPVANLLAVRGILYGTTSEGGTHGLSPKNGVVFRITTSGQERVLHDFGPMRHDGNYPQAGLIAVDGILYGTTGLGNPQNTGTVYSITTDGVEHVIYGFGGSGPAGIGPAANLINVNGALYGTTLSGGYADVGIAFRVTTSGQEKNIHEFGHPFKTDGQVPAAPLLDVNGALYGTTYDGGIYYRGQCGSAPCPGDGTVFKLNGGKVHILHSFGHGSDGLNPVAGLIDVNGTFYGTTALGGQNSDCGTVFSISATGTERVLHSFGTSSNDGCQPAAPLIEVGGTLYGTTEYGGAYNHGGTVFSIETTGSEQVLHSFGNGSDGKNPAAGLCYLNGVLYGSTENGGTGHYGTLFVLNP